jgi:RTA1 like protein
MPNFKCYPISDPQAQWNYCPSFGAAVLFICLFGLTTLTHIMQAILHKKPFAWVLIMGGTWETAGYIFRTLSVEHQLSEAFATAQILLILLAPLWINAFVYMVLGRMVHFFIADDKVFGLKAKRITLIFVLCDISTFLVQAAGGSMTTSSNPIGTQRAGLHVYMGGVGMQLLTIGIFLILCIRFQFKVLRQEQSSLSAGEGIHMEALNSPIYARHLLYLLYTVLGLIVFRNIYRLIEFSSGVLSNITEHEWYAYVFDAVPMFFALVAFNIYHPGRILRGPNSDFSEDKKRAKAQKKEKKRLKQEAKAEKKAAQAEVRNTKKDEARRKKEERRGYFGKAETV